MNITEIVELLFYLVVCLLSVFVIPQLRERLSKDQMEDLLKWVDIAVAAAEQLYDSVDGEAKKNYVLQRLRSRGYTLDADALDTAVEAAVLRLHRELLSGYKTGTGEEDAGAKSV